MTSDNAVFVSRNREKLINAIIYFVRKTKYCHTLKLFKLLNFLDFEHFRQTGKSVTGLRYKAWQNGPAPDELWRELAHPGNDLISAVGIDKIKDDLTGEPKHRKLTPKRAFESRHFTPRELQIMETLANFFEETRGEDMSKISHAKLLPWGKVYENGKGRGKVIPYELSVTSQPIIGSKASLDQEEIERRNSEFNEITKRTA